MRLPDATVMVQRRRVVLHDQCCVVLPWFGRVVFLFYIPRLHGPSWESLVILVKFKLVQHSNFTSCFYTYIIYHSHLWYYMYNSLMFCVA